MSTQNQINIEIPQAVIDGIMQKLNECKMDLAPYLQQLTAEQSISFSKKGNKTIATINKKNKSQIESNSEFVPSFMNKVEFFKDEALVSQANPIHNFAKFFGKQASLQQ